MAEYYLNSQLPSLDGIGESTPLPITEERFLDLCRQFLKKKTFEKIEKITLVPSLDFEKAGSDLLTEWNKRERDLRLALARARAEKLGKSFEYKSESVREALSRAVSAAVEIENPLEAENFLLHYRLDFLEELRPMDVFSEAYLFYYALKLKLILRIRRFDRELGEAAYKNIYSSILNGERLEA